jgi:autotransporter-associated beta strand protein
MYGGKSGKAMVSVFAAMLVSGLLLAAPALGATENLDHASSALVWSNSDLWNAGSGPVPVTGDDVIMQPGGEDTTLYDLGPAVLLHSITLHNHATDEWQVFTQVGSPQIGLQSGATVTDDNSQSSPDTFSEGFSLNGSTSFTLASTGLALHLDGGIVGTGPLTLTNNGPNDGLELSAVNTYTGATTVASGVHRVLFSANGAVPTGSALTVNGVARFAQSSTVGSLAGSGTILVGSGQTLTVGGDNSSTDFAGSLSFSGTSDAALTKVGTGTFTLSGSGTNTYTGPTTVNGGTLNLTGNIDSPVTVNTGATLAGTGTTTNTLPSPAAATANAGGTIAPGSAGVGTLHTGTATLMAGSNYSVELGTADDNLDVTGTVVLNAATLNVSLLGGYVHTPGTVHTIISNDGTDPVSGTFPGFPEGATVTSGDDEFRISYVGGTGNDITLTALSPPPPPPPTTTTTPTTPTTTTPAPPAEDPRCEALRNKLKRQKRALARATKANRANKRAFIKHNIGQTRTRLTALGCTTA